MVQSGCINLNLLVTSQEEENIPIMVSSAAPTTALLSNSSSATAADSVVEGNVDYKGRPSKRGESGRWLSASFIIGVEMLEYFASYGISGNLITYLTGPLGQSTATAAENVNVWAGICYLLPLAGALLADSFLGRYRTVVVASVVYILALGLLTLSAMIPPSTIQIVTFFVSIYMVAVAQGMHKPCVHAFGADQFDGSDRKECKSKSSFFNWCNVGNCLAITLTLVVVTYIQENLSWALGFGIPCLVMLFALALFLIGTLTYRFQVMGAREEMSFSRITRVFVKAAKNWRTRKSLSSLSIDAESNGDNVSYLGSHQFKFLDKALLSSNDSSEPGNVCHQKEVEEAKAVLRLFPIWLCCLVYGIVFSQPATLFTKQGLTMDRFITSKIEVPAASLQIFSSVTTLVFLSLYDRVVVPVARSLTGKPSGITMLQRIGAGIFFSILCISVAALVEKKRLEIAQQSGLLSVMCLVPQYLLMGLSQSLAITGIQEFFYDQVGTEMRSIGVGLYFTIFGVGSLLSGILISVIETLTGRDGSGDNRWFSDDPMKGHLDYFYWLLTGISVAAFVSFVICSKSYIYRNFSN